MPKTHIINNIKKSINAFFSSNAYSTAQSKSQETINTNLNTIEVATNNTKDLEEEFLENNLETPNIKSSIHYIKPQITLETSELLSLESSIPSRENFNVEDELLNSHLKTSNAQPDFDHLFSYTQSPEVSSLYNSNEPFYKNVPPLILKNPDRQYEYDQLSEAHYMSLSDISHIESNDAMNAFSDIRNNDVQKSFYDLMSISMKLASDYNNSSRSDYTTNSGVIKNEILSHIENKKFADATHAVDELIQIKKSSLKNQESSNRPISTITSNLQYESDEAPNHQITLFKDVANLLVATNKLQHLIQGEVEIRAHSLSNNTVNKYGANNRESDIARKTPNHPNSIRSEIEDNRCFSPSITEHSVESENHDIFSYVHSEDYWSDTLSDKPSRVLDKTSSFKTFLSIDSIHDMQISQQILNSAKEVAKSAIQSPKPSDQKTVNELTQMIVDLTEKLENLRSSMTQTENATKVLVSKMSSMEYAVAPAIKLSEEISAYQYEMDAINMFPPLQDYHSGFTTAMEKFCIGAFARQSGLVSTGYEIMALSLIGSFVPGAATFVNPIDFVASNAMEIRTTNYVVNALNNMNSFTVTMNNTIPDLARSVTLYPGNSELINSAKFSRFEVFLRSAEGFLWTEEEPSAPFALGANDALKIIAALEYNQINFKEHSIEDNITDALGVLFAHNDYGVNSSSQDLLVESRVQEDVDLETAASSLKNIAHKNIGSQSKEKLDHTNLTPTSNIVGSKGSTIAVECSECLMIERLFGYFNIKEDNTENEKEYKSSIEHDTGQMNVGGNKVTIIDHYS